VLQLLRFALFRHPGLDLGSMNTAVSKLPETVFMDAETGSA
jgi:hypothetical protein